MSGRCIPSLAAMVLGLFPLGVCAVVPDAEGASGELLGKPGPSLAGLRWLDRVLKPEDLKGKVVVLRWWMGGCPHCRRSAPVLESLYERYRERGVLVIGIYHPKPFPREVTEAEVRRRAAELGIGFPLAVDADWTVLERWWLHRPGRRFTSVTFVLDPGGAVRWVHEGGTIRPEEGRRLEALIRRLLAGK